MIFTFGSINADYVYAVPHLPTPGETLAATGLSRELGGKGANQSVAATRAGSKVVHIGAVGPDGDWAVQALDDHGVGTHHIATVETPTGHAIVNVDPEGENAIVLFPGANEEQDPEKLSAALASASSGDYLLLQNETTLQVEAAKIARSLGVKVVYSAAPFSSDAVQVMLPYTDILVMNRVEADQLVAALGSAPEDLPVPVLIVTRGADGADWIENGKCLHVPALQVTPVDTTGAGDCFIGYVAAGLDQGLDAERAMQLGAAAGALQVQRPGTAGAIPNRADVDAFLQAQASR